MTFEVADRDDGGKEYTVSDPDGRWSVSGTDLPAVLFEAAHYAAMYREEDAMLDVIGALR